jgi:hypothetical protein
LTGVQIILDTELGSFRLYDIQVSRRRYYSTKELAGALQPDETERIKMMRYYE